MARGSFTAPRDVQKSNSSMDITLERLPIYDPELPLDRRTYINAGGIPGRFWLNPNGTSHTANLSYFRPPDGETLPVRCDIWRRAPDTALPGAGCIVASSEPTLFVLPDEFEVVLGENSYEAERVVLERPLLHGRLVEFEGRYVLRYISRYKSVTPTAYRIVEQTASARALNNGVALQHPNSQKHYYAVML